MSAKRLSVAGVAAVAVVFSGGVANAAQVVATFKGVITSGQDAQGKVFGKADLSGLDYEVNYLIDETIFTSRSAIPTSDVPIDQFHYQIVTGYYDKSPILSVSLKVNGVTESFDYDDYEAEYADGQLSWSNYPGTPMAGLDVRGNLGRVVDYSGGAGMGRDYVNFVNQAHSTSLIPYRLSDGWSPAALDLPAIPMTFGRAWGDARGGYDLYYLISGNVTSVTLSPAGATAPIPEPATWALMIGGFGGAGAMLRRRRAVAA